MGDTHSSVPYRLIFLDIDGVLNNRLSAGQLSCPLISALARMVHRVGATVVLSSMWRLKLKHRLKVVAAFLQHGIPLFISCTPHLRYADGDWRYSRVQEILAWLQRNTTLAFRPDDLISPSEAQWVVDERCDKFNESLYTLPLRINVSHLVALDDIDMRQEGGASRGLIAYDHFVLTLMRTGLTEHNIKQAEHILSDAYPPIDMLGLAAPDQSLGAPSAKVLMPYSDRCEECCKDVPQHYDAAINKYFCTPTCIKQFYVTHYGAAPNDAEGTSETTQ